MHIRSKIESLPKYAFPHREGGLFSPGYVGKDWTKTEQYKQADIVHLHWVNRGMLSIEGFNKITKPCVWTLRDMWPFTGGCHYSMECRRYETLCGACPKLGSNKSHDFSTKIQRRKMDWNLEQTTFVGISDWISSCAAKSSVLKEQDIRTIYNSIDTSAFFGAPKKEARKKLGLPLERPILLHGALSLSDAYKGSALLESAKKKLSVHGLYTCSFGAIGDRIEIKSDRNFGLLQADETLRLLYSAADVLAFPSVQEAFGKVLAEAMACGTPAVVFGDTGPGEIVKHKASGYAAVPFDVEDFARGIEWLLADRHRLDMISDEARLQAHQRFSPKVGAMKYLSLYDGLLGNS